MERQAAENERKKNAELNRKFEELLKKFNDLVALHAECGKNDQAGKVNSLRNFAEISRKVLRCS